MIAYRGREGKRGKVFKMSKNVERLYREGKCRDCSVVVTRMDFAKILGKFTKVKIQYESSSSPKPQKTPQTNKIDTKPPLSNARLKNNENGMVLINRNSHNLNRAKDLNIKNYTNKNVTSSPSRATSTNILREINVVKNAIPIKNRNSNYNKHIHSNGKQYALVFNDPISNNNDNHIKCDMTLSDLLLVVDNNILPSEEWCVDYFPKNDEPKNDKVYDRIAAELEDLMYNEKPEVKMNKLESTENKADEFPSIMDILNDNITPENNSETKDQNSNEVKDTLESSDVEAMLLGKVNDTKIEAAMDVDNSDVNKLIEDVVQFSSNTEATLKSHQDTTEIDNPHSPSILDETLQKGIEEHLPNTQSNSTSEKMNTMEQSNKVVESLTENNKNIKSQNPIEITPKNFIQSSLNIPSTLKIEDITHVIFKKVVDGKCKKSVTCPRNLKFSIELEEKSVEFLGAPEYISSIEDLQVLLQIVNETDLRSLYVTY